MSPPRKTRRKPSPPPDDPVTAKEAQDIGLCTGIVQPVATKSPAEAQASLRAMPRAGLANALDAATAAAARARRLRLAEAV